MDWLLGRSREPDYDQTTGPSSGGPVSEAKAIAVAKRMVEEIGRDKAWVSWSADNGRSMEPMMPPWSYQVYEVPPKKARIGQILKLYGRDERRGRSYLYAHRVVSLNPLETKGLNPVTNPEPDTNLTAERIDGNLVGQIFFNRHGTRLTEHERSVALKGYLGEQLA